MTQTYPVLPLGWQRFHLEALLLEVAPALHLGGARLTALLFMMGRTRPSDWTDPAVEPVCHALQAETAQALGKSARALRTDEASLETEFGLLERRVKANGTRSVHGRCGLVFSRLIARVPDLIALRDRLRALRQRRRVLVSQRSVCLRHVTRGLDRARRTGVAARDVEGFAAVLAEWPETRALRSMDIPALEQHLGVVRALCEELDRVLEAQVGLQTGSNSSARAEENFRSPIQENTERRFHDCTAGPGGPGTCGEKRGAAGKGAVKPRRMPALRPEDLYRIAGPDMRAAIDAQRGTRAHIRPLDLILAATDLLQPLGIDRSAWDEACTAMDDPAAALCILILDANRTHPVTPVRNPGGALRGMTRAHRAGRLNFAGSLMGLLKRRG